MLKNRGTRAAILGIASFLVLALFSLGGFSIAYANRIFPNQSIGNLSLGSKTKESAKELISKKSDQFLSSNLEINFPDENKKYTLSPAEINLTINNDKTVEKIWSFGRNGSAWRAIAEQINSLVKKNKQTVVYEYDRELLERKIKNIAKEVDFPEKDYELILEDDTFTLKTDRQEGKRLDLEKTTNTIIGQIGAVSSSPINLRLDLYSPKISEEKAKASLAKANKVMSAGELVLKLKTEEYKVDLPTLGAFIGTRPKGDDLEIVFNDDRIGKYVENLAKSINVEPANAKLAMNSGKLAISTPSRLGAVLDQEQTKIDIKNSLLERMDPIKRADPLAINLKAEVREPEITEEKLGNLGINELVATATTDFKGSSANRVHNIKVGANYLNGIMLKPDELFSTLSHLGKIDASGGYLEELVIKEDRTTPEFGGGLCQVSSTLFRAVLNAGLKITERQNHKYRVSYYEPPVGMDATIYDPSPDLKFINNYQNHLLVQSKVEGSKITFDIYGTKDGRTIAISEPVISEVTAPGPALYVETDSLPIGQSKRLEKAHEGATASFNYKVTSQNGEVLQEKTFRSKYVPWQEKWLVGKGTNIPSNCTNNAQDADETGLDCGGSCPRQCQ